MGDSPKRRTPKRVTIQDPEVNATFVPGESAPLRVTGQAAVVEGGAMPTEQKTDIDRICGWVDELAEAQAQARTSQTFGALDNKFFEIQERISSEIEKAYNELVQEATQIDQKSDDDDDDPEQACKTIVQEKLCALQVELKFIQDLRRRNRGEGVAAAAAVSRAEDERLPDLAAELHKLTRDRNNIQEALTKHRQALQSGQFFGTGRKCPDALSEQIGSWIEQYREGASRASAVARAQLPLQNADEDVYLYEELEEDSKRPAPPSGLEPVLGDSVSQGGSALQQPQLPGGVELEAFKTRQEMVDAIPAKNADTEEKANFLARLSLTVSTSLFVLADGAFIEPPEETFDSLWSDNDNNRKSLIELLYADEAWESLADRMARKNPSQDRGVEDVTQEQINFIRNVAGAFSASSEQESQQLYQMVKSQLQALSARSSLSEGEKQRINETNMELMRKMAALTPGASQPPQPPQPGGQGDSTGVNSSMGASLPVPDLDAPLKPFKNNAELVQNIPAEEADIKAKAEFMVRFSLYVSATSLAAPVKPNFIFSNLQDSVSRPVLLQGLDIKGAEDIRKLTDFLVGNIDPTSHGTLAINAVADAVGGYFQKNPAYEIIPGAEETLADQYTAFKLEKPGDYSLEVKNGANSLTTQEIEEIKDKIIRHQGLDAFPQNRTDLYLNECHEMLTAHCKEKVAEKAEAQFKTKVEAFVKAYVQYKEGATSAHKPNFGQAFVDILLWDNRNCAAGYLEAVFDQANTEALHDKRETALANVLSGMPFTDERNARSLLVEDSDTCQQIHAELVKRRHENEQMRHYAKDTLKPLSHEEHESLAAAKKSLSQCASLISYVPDESVAEAAKSLCQILLLSRRNDTFAEEPIDIRPKIPELFFADNRDIEPELKKLFPDMKTEELETLKNLTQRQNFQAQFIKAAKNARDEQANKQAADAESAEEENKSEKEKEKEIEKAETEEQKALKTQYLRQWTENSRGRMRENFQRNSARVENFPYSSVEVKYDGDLGYGVVSKEAMEGKNASVSATARSLADLPSGHYSVTYKAKEPAPTPEGAPPQKGEDKTLHFEKTDDKMSVRVSSVDQTGILDDLKALVSVTEKGSQITCDGIDEELMKKKEFCQAFEKICKDAGMVVPHEIEEVVKPAKLGAIKPGM